MRHARGEFFKRSREDRWSVRARQADGLGGCLDDDMSGSDRGRTVCRTQRGELGRADEVSCRLLGSEALNRW
jgi:hypothetical protein